ncbi:hypothetical protein [Rhodovulum sulfidophilum]|uniref:hypothetical protein n=1 Tax=Rhodovulum sulfidophilum TaxID=35806 RepID=UPI001923DC6D|nr:hypothetical protein [Rhodovulum sulfidophilum]MBL3561067.1 hypothetical protein [Rhodovulum sulfidophilum]
MQKFKVLRQHLGDRMYLQGDVREAVEADVAHLVAAGVLGAPENKAEAPPEAKARRSRKAADE